MNREQMLEEALRKLLDTREREAKAWFTLENAKANFSSAKSEAAAHTRACRASSDAEKEARAALTPQPATSEEREGLVQRLRDSSRDGALTIGAAWNLLEEAADALAQPAAPVADQFPDAGKLAAVPMCSEQAVLHALTMARSETHKQGDAALWQAFGRAMWRQFNAMLAASQPPASEPAAQQAAPVAVPAGVKVMTTWRNLKTGCEGMHEAGSLPREVDAQPGYEYGTAFLIPAADAQWAMRHLDLLRNRVGDAAMQSLDCVRSWLNAWRVAASPQAAPAPPQEAPAPQPVALTDEQRIDWLCEEAEFTCGQWQVVIDSDKESFLDAVDEMARTAHGITQPSQQEQ